FVCFFISLFFGCRSDDGLRMMLTLAGAGEPHVSGTWVGTLRRVEVNDNSGATLSAAELEILSGPEMSTEMKRLHPSDFYYGGGRVPLITVNLSNPVLADERLLPIGRKVKISGAMLIRSVDRAGPSDGIAVSRVAMG